MATTAPPSPQKSPLLLAGLILFIAGVGGLIGIYTGGEDTPWYQTLVKPAFNPPGYAFGIVWPILYVLMAIATWLIWHSPPTPQRRRALTLFGVQLGVNYVWSFLFFTFHLIAAAAIWIFLLMLLVGATVRAYGAIKPVTAWMLAPYMAWITFASILNATIWYLNA